MKIFFSVVALLNRLNCYNGIDVLTREAKSPITSGSIVFLISLLFLGESTRSQRDHSLSSCAYDSINNFFKQL